MEKKTADTKAAEKKTSTESVYDVNELAKYAKRYSDQRYGASALLLPLSLQERQKLQDRRRKRL